MGRSLVQDDKQKKMTYSDAGVNIDAASSAKKRIGALVRETFTENVLTEVGGFGGLFAVPEGLDKPTLVASSDGVGTKLKAAFLTGIHNTVGQDLVNHCVDDILCTGARPLFFLDYLATGKLDPGIIADVVEGLSLACKACGCSLIGGETAEMPDFYSPGEYDLAGTIVGILERDKALTGDAVQPGDVLLGLPSTGLHTNGYSLVRRVFFNRLGLTVNDYVSELGCTVGEEMLRVHKNYEPMLRTPIDAGWIKSLAHITGGGITDNLPRSLKEGCAAQVKQHSWPVLPIFRFLQEAGNIDDDEMLHVFNMGIGMIAVVSAPNAERLEKHLQQIQEPSYRIGTVVEGETGVRYV